MFHAFQSVIVIQVIHPVIRFFKQIACWFKSVCKRPGVLMAPRTGCFAPPTAAACFAMLQRRHVRNAHNNPMFFVHSFFYFSESHWRPHFSYGFDMTSTCFKSCDPTKLTKITWIRCSFIFPMVFHCFHVSTNRLWFGKVIKT